ncbi:MAG: DegT/DnrJ/EryC1/StrS family aminotransferase, partial [Bacteroidales bacterium]|nr:DegT/DnrJ/EryC1/StrS family aminotransferase [Bacteroidales bacterium]
MENIESRLRKEIIEKVVDFYNEKFGEKRSFIPGQTKVKYAGRVFDSNELINLVDASLDFWLTSGRYADEFETRFAEYFGVSDAILVNS